MLFRAHEKSHRKSFILCVTSRQTNGSFLAGLRHGSPRRIPLTKLLSILMLMPVLPAPSSFSNSLTRQSSATTKTQAPTQSGHFAAGLIENKGQFVDDRGKTVPEVLFKTSIGAVDVYITTKGITYVFTRAIAQELKRQPRRVDDDPETGLRRKISWRSVQNRLAGATIKKENILAERPSEQGYFNYYLSHFPQGITGVRAFQRVTIRSIYPGIDWRLSDEPGRGLKQEFIINPGASPTDIRMSYTGADKVVVREQGRMLRVRTALGEIEEGPLLSHQGDPNQPIKSHYKVRGKTVRFVTGRYDVRRQLVIDPPMHLDWSTLYGGNSCCDGPMAITSDASNDVYITGYTQSTNIPTQASGSSYVQPAGDIFIVKFNFAGVRQWATYYGSPGGDISQDMTTDATGNLYVVGNTGAVGSSFPTMAPSGGAITVQTNNAGAADAFILKFDPAGMRLWATLHGGSQNDLATGVVTDLAGKLFIVGQTDSPDLPISSPPGPSAYWQPSKAGAIDVMILTYDQSGAREWGTFYGGSANDYATDVAWGNNPISPSSIYVIGGTESFDFPTRSQPSAYNQTVMGGSPDAFLIAMDRNGGRFWATYYGGIGYELATSIAWGKRQDIFVAGTSFPSSTTTINAFPTFDPGGGAYFQPTNNQPPGSSAAPNTSTDTFILRFGAMGQRKWATLYGGTMGDNGARITADGLNLYLTGMTGSTNLPTLNPGGNVYFDGTPDGSDIFVASFSVPTFNSGGVLQWATYAGGDNQDFPRGVVASSNCIFVTGEFNSTPSTLPLVDPQNGAYYQSVSVPHEGFLMKFCY